MIFSTVEKKQEKEKEKEKGKKEKNGEKDKNNEKKNKYFYKYIKIKREKKEKGEKKRRNNRKTKRKKKKCRNDKNGQLKKVHSCLENTGEPPSNVWFSDAACESLGPVAQELSSESEIWYPWYRRKSLKRPIAEKKKQTCISSPANTSIHGLSLKS